MTSNYQALQRLWPNRLPAQLRPDHASTCFSPFILRLTSDRHVRTVHRGRQSWHRERLRKPILRQHSCPN